MVEQRNQGAYRAYPAVAEILGADQSQAAYRPEDEQILVAQSLEVHCNHQHWEGALQAHQRQRAGRQVESWQWEGRRSRRSRAKHRKERQTLVWVVR